MDYPTKEQLDQMGKTLQRDVCLWSDMLAREYRNAPAALRTQAEPDPLPEERFETAVMKLRKGVKK